MASVLKINGVAYPIPGSRAELLEWHQDLGEEDVLDLAELPGPQGLVPTWQPGDRVELTPDGSAHPRFLGEITAPGFAFESNGWRIAYRARSVRQMVAKRVPIIAPDFSGQMTFNRPTSDDRYDSSLSGLTVGQILAMVFDQHIDAIRAEGVMGYVQADLDRLTITPPQPVTFEGPMLDGCDYALEGWQGNYVLRFAWHEPDGYPELAGWYIRVVNPFDFAELDVYLPPDPLAGLCDPATFNLAWDASRCYTRSLCRGEGRIEVAFLSTLDGTLEPAWDADDQTDWTILVFENPAGWYSYGDVSSLSSTSATLNPDDDTEEWTVNQWPAVDAVVFFINPISTTSSFGERRVIDTNSSLAAGATGTVGWASDRPLDVGGYTRYRITATASPAQDVYRRFHIVPTWVREHLGYRFARGVPFGPRSTLRLVYYPAAAVIWTNTSSAAYYVAPDQTAWSDWDMHLDRARGDVVLVRPAVEANNSRTELEQGGDSITPYLEVVAVVPYAKDELVAVCPPDADGTGYGYGYGGYGGGGLPVYNGTGYDWFGIRDTLDAYFEGFLDPDAVSQYEAVACMLNETHRDVQVDGSIAYLGLWADVLDLDKRLNFFVPLDGGGYAEHLSELRCPVRSVTVRWHGDGPHDHTTTVAFNNQRRQATGQNVYIHPAFGADPRFGGAGLLTGGGAFDASGGGPAFTLGTQGAIGFTPFTPPTVKGFEASGPGSALNVPTAGGVPPGGFDLTQTPQMPTFGLGGFAGFGGMPRQGRLSGAPGGVAPTGPPNLGGRQTDPAGRAQARGMLDALTTPAPSPQEAQQIAAKGRDGVGTTPIGDITGRGMAGIRPVGAGDAAEIAARGRDRAPEVVAQDQARLRANQGAAAEAERQRDRRRRQMASGVAPTGPPPVPSPGVKRRLAGRNPEDTDIIDAGG